MDAPPFNFNPLNPCGNLFGSYPKGRNRSNRPLPLRGRPVNLDCGEEVVHFSAIFRIKTICFEFCLKQNTFLLACQIC